MNNSTPKSPERAFALQKYLLLHSQHDALQKHLSQITTSLYPSSYSRQSSGSISSETSSSSSQDEPQHHNHFSLNTNTDDTSLSYNLPSRTRTNSLAPTDIRRPSRPTLHHRRSSLPTVIDESILDSIQEDEERIKDVNLQIKSTLTQLLNCESVKGDRRYRMWVQTRLMDAERELKVDKTRRGERRRSEDVGADGFRL